ncbi:hypothetical protein I4U23_017213 [Adineta vaga]|nr:hypothetical protein I4U23_017213 [Adineta vaga]
MPIASPVLVILQRANNGTITQRLSLEPRPHKKKKTVKTGRKTTKRKTKSNENKLKLPRGNVNVDKHVRDYLDSLIDVQPDPVEEDVLDLTPNPNLDAAFDGISNSSSDDSFATANMLDDSIIECYWSWLFLCKYNNYILHQYIHSLKVSDPYAIGSMKQMA